jgi:hypothetical protein
VDAYRGLGLNARENLAGMEAWPLRPALDREETCLEEALMRAVRSLVQHPKDAGPQHPSAKLKDDHRRLQSPYNRGPECTPVLARSGWPLAKLSGSVAGPLARFER